MDIEKWLRGLGLQQYIVAFRDNGIDAEVLPELTDADLEKLGVVLGHRKRLLKGIAALVQAAPIARTPSHVDGAERRQLTVMFCDLVGSTALSARLDPEDMREVIGTYQTCVAELVGQHEGFVAKYIALVTGAGRGIGAATAKRLAAEGASVIVSNRRLETAISVADSIRAAGHEATPVRHDVTAEDDWQAAVGLAATRYGGLDVLVNNAAMMLVKRTEDTTLEEWHAICRVNLDGVFLGTRTALPVMRERAKYTLHGGSIINVSSVGGIVSAGIASAYSMTKGGVRLFTKGTAVEFSRLGYRLRVNSVHPGTARVLRGGRPGPLRGKTGKAQCEHMFSALPLRADIAQQSRHVRFVPKAEVNAFTQSFVGLS